MSNNSPNPNDDPVPLSPTNTTGLSLEFLSPLNSISSSNLESDQNILPTIIYTPPTVRIPSINPNYLDPPSPTNDSLHLPSVPASPTDSVSSESSISLLHSDSVQNTISSGHSFEKPTLTRKIPTQKTTLKVEHSTLYQRESVNFNSFIKEFGRRLFKLLYSNQTLFLFSPNNPIRRLAQKITQWYFFNKFINLLVFFDWITFILYDSLDDGTDQILTVLVVLNSIFVIEILLKSISNGLIFKYDNSELKKSSFIDDKIINEFNQRSGTNFDENSNSNQLPFLRRSIHRIDFLSTLAFWILNIISWTGHFDDYNEIVTILQFINAMRPIRLLFEIPFFHQIIRTLKMSLPLLQNVTLFIAFFFILMGNLGLILFQGTLSKRCFMQDDSGQFTIPLEETFCYGNKTETDPSSYTTYGYLCPPEMRCLEYGNQYKVLNFDNFLSSGLIVFITITNQLYSDIMYHTMATNGWWSSAYFCVIVILFSFWLVDLYVAVIGRIFEKIREEDEVKSSKMKHVKLKNKQNEMTWQQLIGWDTQQDLEQTPMRQFNTTTGTYETIQPNKNRLSLLQWLRSPTKGFPGLIPRNIYNILLASLPVMEVISFILIWLDFILRLANYIHQGWTTNVFFYTNWFLFLTLTIRLLVKKCPYPPRMVQRLTITDYVDTLLILIPIILNIYLDIIGNYNSVYIEVFSIFRVYRVLGIIPGVSQIMSKLSHNLISTIRVLTFMWALLLLVAPMFMEILNKRLPLSSKLEKNENNIMRFDSIQQSVLSLIQLLDSEDWPNQLYEMTFEFTKPSAIIIISLILIIWVFLSNFILARMFIAVAMEGFELCRGEKYQVQLNKFVKNIQGVKQREQSYPISIWNPYRLLPSKPLPMSIPHLPSYLKFRLPTHLTTYLMDPPKNQNPKFTPRDYYRFRFYNDHPNYSRAIYLFRPNNLFRSYCQKLTDTNFSLRKNILNFKDIRLYYHLIIWCAIIGSTVTGALYSPSVRFDYWKTRGGKGHVYWILNIVFTIILTIEFIIIVIANGLLFTPKGYLRSFWNRIDLMALIFQLIDVIMVNEFNASTSRVLHVLVALRAFRLITRTRTLRKTLYSIFISGFFKLLTVLLILMAFIVPFAVIGKAIFGGRLATCNQDTKNIIIMRDCVGNYIPDDDKGILMPRTWANPYMYSFDTLGSSLMILIEIASREKWIDVMRDTMKIVGPGHQPRDEASWWNSTFFVAYCFGVQLIGISTFIAVIISNHREFTGTAEISEDQKNWIDLKKQLDQVKPSKEMVNRPTDLGVKQWCFKTAINKKSWWNRLCSIVYFGIFVLIMFGYLQMSETWRLIRLWGLISCLIIAGVNEIIQMYGRGKQVYLSKPLNSVFLIILVFAIILQVSFYKVNIAEGNMHPYSTILAKKVGFCLTLFVGLKLIVKLDPLLQLIYILKASLKDILQLAYVWFIIFVIYAIAISQAFGNVKWGKNMSYYVNANSFLSIFLLLFRVSTGEGWNDIMYDFKVQSPNCVYNKDYLRSDCGNPWFATILFVSFHAISVYIFASMFVIFLLDTFSYCYEIFASFSFVSRQDLREFKKNWSKLDPVGVGYIHKSGLIKLLKGLETPFKIRLFPTKFNHVNLCREYNRKYNDKFGFPAWKRGTPVNQLNDHAIKAYCKWLQRQLDLLDTEQLHRRKHLFNSIYMECCQNILHSKGRGLQFNQFLKLVVQYKLIDPLKCFLLKDIIHYQKHQDDIKEMYSKCKIMGLFKNYLKKWRTNQLLKSQGNIQLPQIVLGDRVTYPEYNTDESDCETSPPNSANQNRLTLEIPQFGNSQNRQQLSNSSPTSSSPGYSPISFISDISPLHDSFGGDQISPSDLMQFSLLQSGQAEWEDILLRSKYYE